MLRTYRVMVALILIVIVEGCWIPEKFTARSLFMRMEATRIPTMGY